MPQQFLYDFDILPIGPKDRRKSVVKRVPRHLLVYTQEASRKLMPIDEYVAQDLLAWYEVTPYKKSSDYLWATDANRAGAKRGKQPVWLGAVMRDYIQPMARNLGPRVGRPATWTR